MKTFAELFNIILTGNKDESRKASRDVRKLLYSSHYDKDSFRDMKSIIQNAPTEYAKIKEDFRQENFVMAISVIYYLHDREGNPDFLFPWFLKLIGHNNGYIRYAVVRMFSNEFGPLTVHIRCPWNKSGLVRFSPEKANEIIYKLSADLNNLLIFFDKPKYKKYKYINSLPPGPYKTVQQIIADLDEHCSPEYTNEPKYAEYNQEEGIPSPFL